MVKARWNEVPRYLSRLGIEVELKGKATNPAVRNQAP